MRLGKCVSTIAAALWLAGSGCSLALFSDPPSDGGTDVVEGDGSGEVGDDGGDVEGGEGGDTVTPVCGNGTQEAPEECDDGNTTDGDGCSSTCTLEGERCGNGDIESSEACDDGNTDAADGCSATCEVETGWTCRGQPSVCEPLVACGNGVIQGLEECDDGDTDPDDGCDANCAVEPGWTCVGEPSVCTTTAVCGDGEVQVPEECDDGNLVDTDGCPGTCRPAACGDGFVWADHEQCDDGNTTGDDGCSALCVEEICGDGVAQTDEECDDGNPDDTDACPTTCRDAECGDGFIRAGVEECDDGAANSDSTPDACRTTCVAPTCGDRVRDSGESCDDGNTVGGDGCSPTCALESCGNGTVDPGEDCDDRNTDNTDACLDTCRSAACGDGYIWAGREACDGDAPRTCGTTCGTSGTQRCTACSWSTTCTPPTETCNGSDDDCDTVADDGFACARGAAVSCSTTCGTAGTGSCTSTCTVPTASSCTPPAEACNGADDDCDGTTDEGFDCVRGVTVPCVTTCGTAGTGPCTTACRAPTGPTCTPPAETCNGADDDCDGATDNGFTCPRGVTGSCSTTCGTTGTRVCTSSCAWPATCTPPAELCNGIDDDCDGQTDETSVCVPGTTVACTTTCGTAGSGTCTALCGIPTGAACTPPAETCNGIDDNCNGQTDETFECAPSGTRTCTTSCSTVGTQSCTSSCAWPATCTPPAETCNGVDDDCNSACDDTFACCRGSAGTCTTTCSTTGTRSCTTSCSWGACIPPAETCNGADDDCDGTPDDGFECALGSTRTCTIGACTGTQTCSSSCTFGACLLGGPPPGDNCPTTLVISDALGTANYTGSTCAARSDFDNTCVLGGGTSVSAPGPDVVYRLNVTARRHFKIDSTGSGFDTLLYLFAGASCPGGTQIACDDDSGSGSGAARLSGVLDPGTYYVIVDSKSAADYGSYVLTVTVSTPPANDLCADAQILTLSQASSIVSGNTAAAGDERQPACISTFGGGEVWYRFSLTSTTVVYFDTVDGNPWDSVLQLYQGTCAVLVPISMDGCNDNACGALRSQLTTVLNLGTYYIAVDSSRGGIGGPFTLRFQGSNCVESGYRITPGGGGGLPGDWGACGNLLGSINDFGAGCRAATGEDQVLFAGICPSRTIVASTCSASTTFNTVLSARTAACTAASEIACNDDYAGCAGGVASQITFTTGAAGGLHFFIVDETTAGSGNRNYCLNVAGM